MRKKGAMFLALVLAGPLAAGACPNPVAVSEDHTNLFDALKTSPTEMAGMPIQNQIWELWIIAPDEQSQLMLDDGRERIRYGDYERAESVLSDLIEYCPTYAEGWNQRAFVRFLRQDYGRALDDITGALKLEPLHFGALAGRATTLMNMGRTEVGMEALREALKVNPWLSERHMLPRGEDL